VVTLLPGPWGDESITDIPIYRAYAELFLDGTLPYRDVGFEYPPLAAILLALPGIVSLDPEGYRLGFAALTFCLLVVVVLLTGALARATGGEVGRAMVAAALMPLACGATLRTHFDLAPIAAVLGGLVLVCRGHPRTGMAVLGLGIVTKGFPIVVVPVVLAWLAARGERRVALESLGAVTAAVTVVAGGALLLSPQGALDAVTYHTDRPAQIESTASVALLGLDALDLGDARGIGSHRSDGIDHPASGVVAGLLLAVLVGVVALFAIALTRRSPRAPPTERAVALAGLGAVLAYASLGKVLSPQFLIWVAPLAALAFAWRLHALALVIGLATVLTLIEFPAHYADVVARAPGALALVATRDAALLTALALAARELLGGRVSATAGPAPGSARSRSLGPERRPRPARR